MLNNKTNKNLNSEWSMFSYGALCLVYCQAALFSALPSPRASVPVTGKFKEKNLVFSFKTSSDFHYIVKGGQSQAKQKT